MIKQRPRRLISPRMKSGSEGAADRDHIHSQWCGRGSSLFQLNLLRENPARAVLQCTHIVAGFLFHCTCTVPPSPALKAGTPWFCILTGQSAHLGEKQQLQRCSWLAAVGVRAPRPPLPRGAGGTTRPAAVTPSLLAQLSQANGNTAHSEQLSQKSSAPQELPQQQFSRQAGGLSLC